MRAGAISSLLFALTGVSITYLSASILGIGFWGILIFAISVFVAASPYVPRIFVVAKVTAVLAAVISVLAVLLGLVAATVGGSFRLPPQESLLLALFAIYALSGILFCRAKLA